MEKRCESKRHSDSFWIYIAVIAGVLWLLSRNGWDIHLPGFGSFFSGIGHFFSSMAGLAFNTAFPVFLIIIGIALILARRFLAALFLVVLFLIIMPSLIVIPGILITLFFPFILIILGIVILSRLFGNR